MLSKSLLAFLLAPVCLGIGIRERYATFHTSDHCSDPADPNYENFNMDSNACIDQQGRHSLMPGKKATTAGVYCFVYYEEDSCNCIKGARKIHPSWKDDPSCETKEVAGYKSYHFEHAKHGECPVRGCYGLDPNGNKYPVEYEYVEEDSQGSDE